MAGYQLIVLFLVNYVSCQNSLTDVVNQLFLNTTLYEEVTHEPLRSFGSLQKCGESQESRRRMRCVPYYNCDGTTSTVVETTVENGFNTLNIDLRFEQNNQCDHYLDVCCQIPEGGNVTSTTSQPTTGSQNSRSTTRLTTSRSNNTLTSTTPGSQNSRSTTRQTTSRSTTRRSSSERITTTRRTTRTTVAPSTSTEPSENDSWSNCGVRNLNGIDFKLTGNINNEYAEYGEFPWQIALLRTNYEQSRHGHQCICGGSLIRPNVVLTAAHCVESFRSSPREISARAGEWDSQTTKERIPHQERLVTNVIVHENYGIGAINDIAILILDRPFSKTRSVGTICLPRSNQEIRDGTCLATGWGKSNFGKEGAYSVVLKKIELPIVSKSNCERMLQRTRLGSNFTLHTSFLCAGGEEGKDTCTGDGGSPLVCIDPRNPGRYIQSGIVSWGIGCGQRETPGVYTNVARLRNWIDRTLTNVNN